MMTFQEIIDRTRAYFLDRLVNRGGQCQSGWGSYDNPKNRCAIGSLVGDRVYSCAHDYKLAVANLLGVPFSPGNLLFNHFASEIIRFNDHHATGDSRYKLNITTINELFDFYSLKYGLDYAPITPGEVVLLQIEKRSNLKFRHNIKELEVV